jgi:hypothetical protein
LGLFLKLNSSLEGILIELRFWRPDPTKSEGVPHNSVESSLVEAEKLMEKYYPRLLEEVEEIQGFALYALWGRGVEVRIGSKASREPK